MLSICSSTLQTITWMNLTFIFWLRIQHTSKDANSMILCKELVLVRMSMLAVEKEMNILLFVHWVWTVSTIYCPLFLIIAVNIDFDIHIYFAHVCMPLEVICGPCSIFFFVQRVSKRYYESLFKHLNPLLSFRNGSCCKYAE